MDAPPETFLGYPCRASKRLTGRLPVALIVNERWVVVMFRKITHRDGNATRRVAIYSCKIRDGDAWHLDKVYGENTSDDLEAFKLLRQQLEELDGRRS